MRSLKILLLNILIINIYQLGYCQNKVPEITSPSPNASGLGVYGEVPVSFFTGIPNIEVPLYTLKEGNLTLPVSLSYYASGIKPDQHPGWVGLNWSLNAGGIITRITHDLPDEYNCPNTTLKRHYSSLPEFNAINNYFDTGVKGENAGYYFNHSVNSTDQWSSASNIVNLVNNQGDAKDTEPDEFSFNFCGYSGKFYLTDAGTWAVQSDQNVKVIFDPDNFVYLPASLTVSKEKHYQANCLRRGDNMKSFGGFTIITDSGVRYVFGTQEIENKTNSIEYSIPFFQQLSEQWVATSWYLTKIISPNGEIIRLTYEPDDYISNMYIYFLWNEAYYYNGNNRILSGGYGNQYAFGQNEWTADWINPRYASYLGNLIRPTYLTKIEGTNVSIDFVRTNSDELKYSNDIYIKNKDIQKMIISQTLPSQICHSTDQSPEYNVFWPFLYDIVQSTDDATLLTALKWKKLDSIKISDKSNSSLGWIYTLNFNNTASERLKLDYISKKSIDNAINQAYYYRFGYYDDPNISIPNYLEECTDHWGFYNGNTQKCLTQLRTWDFTQNGPANLTQYYSLREPTNDINVAAEGSLKSITYPTKGKTTFEYEQNTYSKLFDITACDGTAPNCLQSASGNPKCGGLRIKKITTEPVFGPAMIKEYFYVKNYTLGANVSSLESSGILGGKNQYIWYNYNSKVNSSTVKKIEKFIISGQSVLPMSVNSQGVQLGYSEVVEKKEDGSYSIYKYSNYSNEDQTHFDEKPLPGSYNDISPYFVYSSKSLERGKLLSTEVYTKNGIKSKQDNYLYKGLSTDFVRSLNLIANTYVCYNNELWTSYVGLPYKRYVYKYFMTKETINENYNPTGQEPLIKTTHFLYNSLNLLSNKTSTNGRGKTFESRYKYPFEFSESIYSTMATLNMLNYPIEETTSVNNNITTSKLTTYKVNGSGYVPDKVYSLETATPLASTSFAAFNGTTKDSHYGQTPEYSFDTYDTSNGNPLKVLGKNGIYTYYVWAYNKTYPVAKIESSVNTTINITVDDAQLKKTTVYADIQADVAYLKGLVNSYLTNKDYLVTLYTYTPLIGMTSQTDHANRTSYYEYDEFGRLKLVRDLAGNILKKYEYHYAGILAQPTP